MKIVGKYIVITGGASGIGLELVKQLNDENEISVIARPSSGLNKLRHEYGGINVIEADLADLKSVENAAESLVGTGKNVDILINNAAVQYTPHFWMMILDLKPSSVKLMSISRLSAPLSICSYLT